MLKEAVTAEGEMVWIYSHAGAQETFNGVF